MDNELRKQILTDWADALRSGEYKQGYNTLKTCEGKYCCLGVLLAVINKKYPSLFQDFGLKLDVGSAGISWQYADSLTLSEEEGWSADLPSALAIALRIDQHALVHLNDSTRVSFEDIARIIDYEKQHDDGPKFTTETTWRFLSIPRP